MSLGLMLLLGLMLAAALALVLLPYARPVLDPPAEQRAALEAQRDDLYTQLRQIPDTDAGDVVRLPLEARAARILRQLDELPATPPPPQAQGRSAALARAGWGVALALTLAGALTLFPAWQKLGIGAAEASQVTAAQQLPGLRSAAQSAKSAASYNAWGDAAFQQGSYGEALRAYTESLKLDPRQPQPLRRLGTLLLNRESMGGQPLGEQEAGQAFALIRTAASLAPDEPESQLLLGYALVKFGEEEQALAALERYRELDPQGRDADELISSIRSAQNSASPALEVYSASCASCHGPAGNGGLGPSLRESNLTRDAAAQIIVQGRASMPAFPDLKDADLNALLDLLQEWQPGSAGASASATAPSSAPSDTGNSMNNESAGSLSGNGLNVTGQNAGGQSASGQESASQASASQSSVQERP
ncbi:cytochrome c family protein [Deinococcus piscis]|uniref:Cytochrome c family protein n=1 Tax=Deinococcus piscis TaxID=394230 RepID=A0ABQ3K508_9DEIO|nr:cytochrome c [Deinococcus piscis]GHF98117.1 cytochrome c family protein [Deinococcus piscis]